MNKCTARRVYRPIIYIVIFEALPAMLASGHEIARLIRDADMLGIAIEIARRNINTLVRTS